MITAKGQKKRAGRRGGGGGGCGQRGRGHGHREHKELGTSDRRAEGTEGPLAQSGKKKNHLLFGVAKKGRTRKEGLYMKGRKGWYEKEKRDTGKNSISINMAKPGFQSAQVFCRNGRPFEIDLEFPRENRKGRKKKSCIARRAARSPGVQRPERRIRMR